MEAVVSAECVLATNTSSLSVTEMGARAARTRSGWSASTSSTRSRCCRCWRSSGAAATDDATLATAFAVGRTLKKSCVLVKDAPAFVVNRLLTRFMGEVDRRRRRGHAAGGGRARAGRAGPADDAVRAAGAGRPGRRAARGRDAARGVPGPVPRLGEPGQAGRGRQAGRLPARTSRSTRRSWRCSPAAPRRRRPSRCAPRALRGAGRGDPPHAGRGRGRRGRRTSTCA